MKRAVAGLGIVVACLAAQAHAGAPAPRTGPGAAAVAALVEARDEARARDPDAVQRRYEVARAVGEALAAISPLPRCRRAYDALSTIAHGSVLAAEGVDRIDALVRRRGERAMAAGLASYRVAAARCPHGIQGGDPPTAVSHRLVLPLAGEAFFGRVRLAVPAGTRRLELRWRGRTVLRLDAPRAGLRTFRLPDTGRTGRGTLEAIARSARGTTRLRAATVWLLPPSAERSTLVERMDARLATRLARVGTRFPGYAGIYVHEMATGRTAAWNGDARFPAASTVKLGVLAAALDRFGPRPERSAAFYDMRALAAWSSNLAANRLVRSLGSGDLARGRALVEARLRRMGAMRSTYPGEYRVGTSRARGPVGPPLVSSRTTSAADLGRVLASLQAAATGSTRAMSSSGLSRHEASVGLALLLDSEPVGDNAGLFQPWLGETPAAQKHGWITSARHSAALIYGPRGPVVVVVLTYRQHLSLEMARRLGRQVVLAALGRLP